MLTVNSQQAQFCAIQSEKPIDPTIVNVKLAETGFRVNRQDDGNEEETPKVSTIEIENRWRMDGKTQRRE